MKMKCAALTIAVALAVGFHAPPLTAQVPPQGRVYRLGMLAGEGSRPRDRCRSSRWDGRTPRHRCGLSATRGRPQRRPRSPICRRRRSIGFRPSRPSWSGFRVDLIFTRGAPATRAAKAATATIPILFSIGVRSG